jgi:HPt (histidine-containing phosphotransfer) domain-containing protein
MPAVEPAQPHGPATFDPVRIATLKRLLPEEELADFVGMFVGSLEGVIGRANELLDNREFSELTQEAHALAGTAGNLGAVYLAQCARELERAWKDTDAASSARAVSALRHVVPETKRELAAWVDAQRPTP